MCDWETEVKMLTAEVVERQAELDEYKVALAYARIMRDSAGITDET